MTGPRLALVSVSDKSGLGEFCQVLKDEHGFEFLSTGGTRELLLKAGLTVRGVADYTDFPELLDGRLKTLHPRIHGGLLGRPGLDEEALAAHDISLFGLLVVNLYPFEKTIARPDCKPAEAIEQIDIGGPAMLRAAAKNHAAVGVVSSPDDYPRVLEELRRGGGSLSDGFRLHLAQKAFALAARYDGAISNYLGGLMETDAKGATIFPRTFTFQFRKRRELRYGENPHQGAALYLPERSPPGSLAAARLLQGKALSYNNLLDVDTALKCSLSFTDPCCAIVKHANPCGVALAESSVEAYDLAYRADQESAFGGVIAFNRRLDEKTARAILERQFVEVIAAPEVAQETLAVLAAKANVRVLACGRRATGAAPELEFRRINGGLLVQDADQGAVAPEDIKLVSARRPTDSEWEDLSFAWRVVRHVRSNAIVLARGRAAVGIGGGQPSRLLSVRIALLKARAAQLDTDGAVLASDAFFPFPDGVEEAAREGIRAIIQPGGAQRDAEVIGAVNRLKLAMLFTGMRHFAH